MSYLRSLSKPELPRTVPVIPYSHSSSIQRLHLEHPKMDFLDVLCTVPSSCGSVQLDTITAADAPSIGTFLRHLGESLKHLKFGFLCYNSGGGEAFCDHVDLRHNTGLRSIHITDIIYAQPFIGCQHLTSLPSILGRCALPHLTDITFSIYLAAFREFSKFVWPALDDSLMSLVLNSPVTLTFYIPDFPLDHPQCDELLPALQTDIQSLLPNSSPRFNVLVVPGGENPRPIFGQDYEG
ncbi:hypothetical protein FB451DRAFT_1488299 [Mycena latifolia]|nr:hypothetical protein FB451DRAFT_1488299 [Mycena latifolia]